jgi:hypothetical protein
LLSQGLSNLYNLQYDNARRHFSEYSRENPSNAAGYFYLTATDWWQLAENFEIKQPALVKQFNRNSEKTIELAEQQFKKSVTKSARAQALLFEGGAWGLRGRLEVTQGQWIKAYGAGKRGHAALLKAIALKPDLYDAYLGLGIYDYYAATLKGVQALLSKILVGGNRKRGLEEIKLAMEKGDRSRTEATVFLIDIYTAWEKEPGEAVNLAQTLLHEYPQSPAMHLALISSLSADRQWDAVATEAESFLKHVQNKDPYYENRHLLPALYYSGLAALHREDAATCVHFMNDLLAKKEVPTESRWITLAYLRRGQACDMQKERSQAKADYKHVLARPAVVGSHGEAQAALNVPFKLEED